MDENNNNQLPPEEMNKGIDIPIVKNFDPKLFVAVVVLILLILWVMTVLRGKMQTTQPAPDIITTASPELVVSTIDIGPEKISAGEALPEGFPKELILEEGVSISEGFTLSYTEEGKTQLTAMFSSNKTAKENYDAYEKYLTEKFWIISNKYESENISSLYAINRGDELNITIEANEDSSKVIINLLKN